MTHEKGVSFPCGPLSLEGYWNWPSGEGPFPAVVVCHPHPLFGGDMWNNVVEAVCTALAHNAMAAFRFNFRGVGHSQGSYGDGLREGEDVRAALEFVSRAKRVDAQRLGLVGYSFGARVVVATLPDLPQIAALALISLPLPAPGAAPVPLPTSPSQSFAECQKPKLLIGGDRDSFSPAAQLRPLVETLASPKEVVVIPGADHFWWGRERELAQAVLDFFLRNLGSTDQTSR